MHKQVSVASYWLGLASVVMAIIFRLLAAIGIWPVLVPATGAGISYVTFHHAAEILLLLSIAARLFCGIQSEKI
jgi:hypothetical protein